MIPKKILITGAEGFIGTNLSDHLNFNSDFEVLGFDRDTNQEILNDYVLSCDYLVHLAGVNRPINEDEFDLVNFGFTKKIVDLLKQYKKDVPIIFSSSTQVEDDNLYGKSKLKAENVLLELGKKQKNNIYIFRFPGVFGAGCKPNYNSVVATFCNNIANDIPIEIHDPKVQLNLIYIEDVIKNIGSILKNLPNLDNPISPKPVYRISVKDLADTVNSFSELLDSGAEVKPKELFEEALYKTYLSYQSIK